MVANIIKKTLGLCLITLTMVGCQADRGPLGTMQPPPHQATAQVPTDYPQVRDYPQPAQPPRVQPQLSHTMQRAAVPAGIPAEWLPPVAPRQWHWIVIHHSATATGGAAAFDRMHRAKGWDELGYHFVIGNGTDTRDGLVEVGPRWFKQKYGAHAKTPDNRFNDFGIGICMVGNFDETRPTSAQLQSMARLVAYLMKTYHISEDCVIGHRDTKGTDCPGNNTSIAQIRRLAAQYLAQLPGEPMPLAASEMPKDATQRLKR